MYKNLSKSGLPLLLLTMLSLAAPTAPHAQTNLSQGEVSPTGQWLDARKALFKGMPIPLHLRVGHERALLMPEPVRLSNTDHQSSGYTTDINRDVVRFYPQSHFKRESLRLTGLETGTEYLLRVRASAFGIRQPLQIFLKE